VTDSSYVQLDDLKEYLDVTDNLDDPMLSDLIKDVNQEIEIRMLPFADSLPLTGAYFQQAKRAGAFYVVSCWKQEHNNSEAAKSYMEKFESKMEMLIKALEAIPTERTDTVVYAPEYKSEPLRSRERFFD